MNRDEELINNSADSIIGFETYGSRASAGIARKYSSIPVGVPEERKIQIFLQFVDNGMCFLVVTTHISARIQTCKGHPCGSNAKTDLENKRGKFHVLILRGRHGPGRARILDPHVHVTCIKSLARDFIGSSTCTAAPALERRPSCPTGSAGPEPRPARSRGRYVICTCGDQPAWLC
jgi:hypothetical protein